MANPRRCPATSKRTGEQCKRFLPPGAKVCKWHGGGSPQALAAQDQRQAVAELDRTVQSWIREPVTDPFEALATMGGEVVGLKDALAAKVAELESYAAVSAQGVDHVRAEMVLYERALDRAMKFLADWVRLDMEERIVKLRERISDAQATRLQDAVTRALAVLPGEHRESFKVALANELRSAA
jgi:hypothetical protein